MKYVYKFFILLVVCVFISNCARTGRPEGGPKDIEAPLFVTADPPYKTINFNEKEIKIYFNEYIKLKDLNKQFVVSPPMKSPPVISPQGAASKFIKIKILDTLKTKTTYILNFGNAVEDNNENNKLENFKYVFSTGNYVDSLTTSGSVKDSKSPKDLKNINVLLYRIDSTFNDSIIYKEKPSYVTNTLDSTRFNFTNLRKGKYLMVALQESVNDYIFNSLTDKIGFYKDTISLPRDSVIKQPILLFKENQPYEIKRGKEITKGKIEFGFIGDAKNMKVELLSKVPDTFKSVSKFMIDKDTLNFWHTPIEVDSLNFIVKNNDVIDTVTVKLRKKKIDSLEIESSIKSTLHFRDTFFIKTNNPIIKIDTSKISVFDKDTIAVKYKSLPFTKENKIGFLFEKKPKNKYKFKFYPKAFIDIFSDTNDTIKYNFTTKEIEDYGRITLNVDNVKSKNLIIELLSGKNQDEIIEQQFISSSSTLIFDLLEPKNYTIRAIIDDNKNNKWDTGNYLMKLFPEKIIYHNAINDTQLRANYFLEESFIIE